MFVATTLRLPTTDHTHPALTNTAGLLKRLLRPVDTVLHRAAARALPGARVFRRTNTGTSATTTGGPGGGGPPSEQPTPRYASAVTTKSSGGGGDADGGVGTPPHGVHGMMHHGAVDKEMVNGDGSKPVNGAVNGHKEHVDQWGEDVSPAAARGSPCHSSPPVSRNASTRRSMRRKSSTASSGQSNDQTQRDGQTQRPASLLSARQSWKGMLWGSRKHVRQEVPTWALAQTVDMLVASAAQFGGYATSTVFEVRVGGGGDVWKGKVWASWGSLPVHVPIVYLCWRCVPIAYLS